MEAIVVCVRTINPRYTAKITSEGFHRITSKQASRRIIQHVESNEVSLYIQSTDRYVDIL